MAGETADAEAHTRATLAAHATMLRCLWVYVLEQWPEPIEEAKAVRDAMLPAFEVALSHLRGRDAEVTQHLALGIAERMWTAIMGELSIPEPEVRLPRDGEEGATPDDSPPDVPRG